MAPKKDETKGKGGGAGPSPDDIIIQLKAQNEAMQTEVTRRNLKLVEADTQVSALTAKVLESASLVSSSDATVAELHAETSRQIKTLTARYEERIAGLEREVARLSSALEASAAASVLAANKAAAEVKARDDAIAKLNKAQDDSTSEFGDILAETLRRVALQLDVPIDTEESGPGGPAKPDLAAMTLKKMQEMTLS
jgi:hypothetical protein